MSSASSLRRLRSSGPVGCDPVGGGHAGRNAREKRRSCKTRADPSQATCASSRALSRVRRGVPDGDPAAPG